MPARSDLPVRPRHRASATRFRRAAAWLTVALTVTTVGLSIGGLFAANAATAAAANPMAPLKGFTILTEGDFTTTANALHVEGSAAVGGDFTVQRTFNFNTTTHSAALPIVDGRSTQLLTGGRVLLGGGSGEEFGLDQGDLRVGDPTGYLVSQDGVTPGTGIYYSPVGDPSKRARMHSATTLDAVTASGLFAQTFSGSFATLRDSSASIRQLTGGADAVLTSLVDGTNFNGISGSDKGLALTAGATNIVRVDAATLSSVGFIKFLGNVVPSAGTTLVFDVTDSGGVALHAPSFTGDAQGYAAYTLFNLPGATALTVTSDNQGLDGSLLAPNAAVTIRGALEGQIAARSLVDDANSEIHHIPFIPQLPPTNPPTSSTPPSSSTPPTQTTPPTTPDPVVVTPQVGWRYAVCDQPTNSLSLSAVAGVHYVFTSGLTGAVASAQLSGDQLVPGTPYTFSAVADAGYALAAAARTSWSITFPTPPTDCGEAPPSADASGSWTVNDTCSPSSTYTLGPVTNATYEVSVEGATPISQGAGTYPAIQGKTVSVRVVPAVGHVLAPGSLIADAFRFGASPFCGDLPTFALVHGAVQIMHEVCASPAQNGFTLAAVEGIRYTLTLGGVTSPLAPGSYTQPALGSPYRIDAYASSVAYGLDADEPSSWTFSFASATNCAQLATLAYTGSMPVGALAVAGAGIAGGAVLLAAGLVITASRRRRT